MHNKTFLFLILIFLLSACGNSHPETTEESIPAIKNPTNKILHSSDIIWEKLNPARGDQSPQAGTIWGDRKADPPTGFLAKFVDGFSSPPHIHNVTYRAVVIKGEIHNDDPAAENMWMKPGAFWTQPAGESHITSARGNEIIALVEIDHGPYLVKPTEEAFDNGERPVNIDVSNIVWLDHQQCNWIPSNSDCAISFLLQENDLTSLFVRLPKGYNGTIETNGSTMHAVVIEGALSYTIPQSNEVKDLDAGSYFSSTDRAKHTVKNNTENEVIVYFRTNGIIDVK